MAQNDGYRLLTLPFASETQLESFLATTPVIESTRQFEMGRPDEAIAILERALSQFPKLWTLRHAMAAAQIQVGNLDTARAMLTELAEEQTEPPQFVWFAKANLAYVYAKLKDATLKDDADRLSKESMKLLRLPAIQGIRGWVLLWLEQPKSALKLFTAAYRMEPYLISRAESACGAAIAAKLLGQDKLANRWLEKAQSPKTLPPSFPEAARVVKASDYTPSHQ
ncbi:MAG: tetratricopeptide repeat protein [Myxococcota bacterium]